MLTTRCYLVGIEDILTNVSIGVGKATISRSTSLCPLSRHLLLQHILDSQAVSRPGFNLVVLFLLSSLLSSIHSQVSLVEVNQAIKA